MPKPRKVFPPYASVEEIIRVKTTEGEGTEESPMRPIIWYYDKEGHLLASYDEWEEQMERKKAMER